MGPLHLLRLEGLSLEVPGGWEARIRRSSTEREPLELPVVHAATVPLPPERGDYGGGVVEKLDQNGVFVSLIEFGPEAIESNLFPAIDSVPRVEPEMFHPFQLQRRIPGQAGKQVFFTYRGRAFCLYLVIGSFARRVRLAAKARELLEGLAIDERP